MLGIVGAVALARHLGVGVFGDYSAVMAYAALAVSIGNLGIDQLAYRELSAAAGRGVATTGLFKTLFALRMVSAGLSAAILVGVGMVSGEGRLWPFVLVALATVPGGAAAMFTVAFQAQERFSVPARAGVWAAATSATLILIGVVVRAPLVTFFSVLVVSDMVRLGCLVRHRVAEQRGGHPSRGPKILLEAPLRTMLSEAAPYWVLSILGMVYFRIDVIMLDLLRGSGEVGLYASASRFFTALNTIPALCLGVLFPRFVQLQRDGSPHARRLYLLVLRVMAWTGGVVAVVGVLAAGPLIRFVYGAEYTDATPALAWLMLGLLFVFWQAPNGTALFAGGRLRGVVALSFVTAGFNVVGNLVAIPRWGAAGAAMTTTASELLSLMIFSVVVGRRLGISPSAYVTSLLTLRVHRVDRDFLLGRPLTSPAHVD